MRSVNMHEAKTNLSRLADDVANGEEIIVAKAGKPKIKLTPIDKDKKEIKFGLLKGKIKINNDFDDPLPQNLLDKFSGV